MGIFDSIKNLISGASGQIGDAVGGLVDVPGVQELQEHATTLSGGVTESVTSVTEQGKTVVEKI